MLQAAFKELKTTPIATIGALAGIASFAIVVANPPQAGVQADVDVRSTTAALAFIKLALVVPGVAFFFAFLSHLAAVAGPLRWAFATAVFLLMCEVFTAAASGVILSEVRIGYYRDSPTILGIPVIALGITIFVTNLLVFASVLAPTVVALWPPDSSQNEDDRDSFGSGPELGLILYGGLFVIVCAAGLIVVVLQASLGLIR